MLYSLQVRSPSTNIVNLYRESLYILFPQCSLSITPPWFRPWTCVNEERLLYAKGHPNYTRGSHTLEWRHNEHNNVSKHRRLDCLLNRLFRRRSKKTSKLRVIGLGERNPPVTGGFPSQRASTAESVSIWWRHHANVRMCYVLGDSHHILCCSICVLKL